jgi:hypothetical protein
MPGDEPLFFSLLFMVSSMGQLGNDRSINSDGDGGDARAATGQGQWQLQWGNGAGSMATAMGNDSSID